MHFRSKFFEKLKKESTLVNVCTDAFDENKTGYLLDFNDEFMLIETIYGDGLPDGIIVFKREYITRLRWGGNELESFSQVLKKQPRLKLKGAINIASMPQILQSVQKEFGYVAVHIQNIDPDFLAIGQIEEMDNDTLILHEYGTFSTRDRQHLMISMDEITRVDAGGSYENNVVSLFK